MRILHTKWLLSLTLLAASLLLGACTADAGEDDAGTSEAVLVAEEEVATVAETATPGADDLPGDEATATEEAVDETAAVEATEPVGPIEFIEPATRWITSGRLVGAPVFASDGLQLGRIVDILFSEQGELRYVIVSAPEALGEEALAAIPWGAMQFRRPEGDLSPGDGEPAEETDEEGILDAPDPYVVFVYPSADQLQDEIHVEERLFRDGAMFAGEEMLAAIGADDEEGDATREAAQNRLLLMSQFEEFDLVDYPVLDEEAEGVGEVEQLIVDMQAGTVNYALVETGGFMGVGQVSVAIPWDALSLSLTAEEFVLLVSPEVLQDAPSFDPDAWASGPADEAWNEPVDEYWAEL